MGKNWIKSLLVAVVSVMVLGILSWYLLQQLIIHEPVPDSAMKVLGWLWRI